MHRVLCVLWFSILLLVPAVASAQRGHRIRPPLVPADRGVGPQAAPDLWLATSEGFRMFTVRGVHGSVAPSGLFELMVEATTTETSYDPADLLGELVTVGVRTGATSFRIRSAHVFGVSSNIVRREDGSEVLHVSFDLGPWIRALAMTTSYATFEDVNAVDVVRAVFARYPFARFEVRVNARALPRHALIAQYRESDLDFVLGVLADDDLRFEVEHSPHGHTLVITDTTNPRPRGRLPVLTHDGPDPSAAVSAHPRGARVRPNVARAMMRDPADPTRTSTVERRARPNSAFGALVVADHLHPAPTRARAEQRASARLASMRDHAISVTTANGALDVGDAFVLRGHPRAGVDGAYRAISGSWMADGYVHRPGTPVRIHGTLRALPLGTPREAWHVQGTWVAGTQTATVIAPPEGQTREGHVRVRLHWAPSPDGEMPSAWVPVHGDGHPQPGQEVLLHFLEGDPSRPIIWTPSAP